MDSNGILQIVQSPYFTNGLFLAIIAYGIYLTLRWNKSKQVILSLMLFAEKEISLDSKTRMFNFVVDEAYKLLPNTIKFWITKERFSVTVQSLYDKGWSYMKEVYSAPGPKSNTTSTSENNS